jgi:hypothetical protein
MKRSDYFGIRGKSEAIPVKGGGAPWGCKTSKIPHFAKQSEGLDKLKKFNGLIRNRTRDLPARSIVP